MLRLIKNCLFEEKSVEGVKERRRIEKNQSASYAFSFWRSFKILFFSPSLPRLLIMQGAKTYFDSFLPFSTAKVQR
jgi:hypothetical protein